MRGRRRLSLFSRIAMPLGLVIFAFAWIALNVTAASSPFKISDATITDKTGGVDATINGFEDTKINSSATFYQVNGSITYAVTLQNTTDKNLKISAITDDNSNPYLAYSYTSHAGEEVAAGGNLKFDVTVTYVNNIPDPEARIQNFDVKFLLDYEEIAEEPAEPETPAEEDEDIVVPNTNDDTVVPNTGVGTAEKSGAKANPVFITAAIIGAVVMIYGLVRSKLDIKTKAIILAVFGTLATMTVTNAVSANFTFEIANEINLKDLLYVTSEVNGVEAKSVVNYGGTLSLVTPQKAGYTFVGWQDENGNPFNPATPITDDAKIKAVFIVDNYAISYDLNGGTTATSNTTSYTVNDSVSLIEPTKEYYDFTGWTGTDLTEPTKNVVIVAGSTGNREYTANYTPVDYRITYDNITPEELVLMHNPTSYNIETASFTLRNPETRRDGDGDATEIFIGWNDGGTISNTVTLPNASSMDNKNFVAVWEPVSSTVYTITYNLNGGTTATANHTEFTKETESFTLVNPTKLGYQFKGWSGTDLVGGSNTSVQVVQGTRKNLSFEAHYIANTYKVIFDANGGTGNMADQTLTYDTAANLNANTYTKTGYSFGGWNSAAGGTGTAYTNGAEVENLKTEGETTLYAQWTANSYLVAFDCNHAGCEGTMENLPMVYDVEKALPLNVFSVPGYTFTGWGTGAAGDGDSYGNGAEVNNLAATGAITLYAQWTTVDYDISYELNGGTAENPATYTTEQTITLNNPTKTGYNFTGWSGTDLDGEDDMEVTIPVGSTGNRNYTANWSDPINYSIEYTGLDALTEEELAAFTNPTTYTIESSFTLSNPAHLGYQFVGWTGSNGDTLQTTVNVAAGTTGSLNYHANFAANTFTVVFEKNPGTHNIGGDMDAQAFIYDTEQALTDNAFTIDEPGFKYGGWNTEADGSGTHYDDKQTVENLTAENEGTVTLYAEWGRTPYTIAFDKNNENATGEMLPIENITYGEHITLPQVGFVYNDHKIASWNTEPDGSGRSYGDQADVVNVAIDGTVTLYAQWRDTEAVFLGGTRPKMKWIALAGGNQANITAIRQYAGTPDVTTFTDDNIVSEETSPDPIYTWYDNGTIYYWSEDNHPALSAFSREMFDGLTKAEVIEVENLDTSNVTNMIYMFRNCSSLKSLDLSNFDTSKVTTMHQMFNGCSSLAELDVSTFDTKNVTDMHGMFANCSGLTELDVSNFDTSNVTIMIGMFQNDSGLTEIDITGFNTENVKSISGMFMGCTRLTEIDLSHMNTQKITDMSNLFRGCTNLENVIFGEDFKAEEVTTMQNMFMGCTSLKVLDLSTFEATKVTNVYQMFLYDNQLETIYVTNPEAFSNITDSQDMFHSCGSLVGGMGTVQSQIYRSGERAFIDLGPDRPGYFTDKTKLNIFFDANGGSGTMQNQTGLPANTDVTLNPNQFNTPGIGRIFGGWNTEPDGTGTHYDDQQIVNTYGRLVLYAQWGETPYTVIFDKNSEDATGTMESISKYYGERFNLPASGFERLDHDFKGWNTEADGTGIHYDDEQEVINLDEDGEVTLYAEWKEIVGLLQSGTAVNTALKQLANDSSVNYTYYDSNVLGIKRVYEMPELSSIDYRIISSSTSEYEVYAWFDDTTKYLYMYSDAKKIGMPKDSSYMFNNFLKAKEISLEGFSSNNTTNMDVLFGGCESVESLDLTPLNVSEVTSMYKMLKRLKKIKTIDMTGWDTSNVTDMSYMFEDDTELTTIIMGDKWNTEKVTRMENMFNGCNMLGDIDLTHFDTSNVENMAYMFSDCSSLSSLNLSAFDTSKVKDMSYMFKGCDGLTTIDISSFDTREVKNMSFMFQDCAVLETITTGELFKTDNVTNMYAMFADSPQIVNVDFSKFNTENVTNFQSFIARNKAMTTIDLSSFDTRSATNVSMMFQETNLVTIYVTNKFDVTGATANNGVFRFSNNLVGGSGTTFSDSHYMLEYARIDDPDNGKPGYFTDIADKPVEP